MTSQLPITSENLQLSMQLLKNFLNLNSSDLSRHAERFVLILPVNNVADAIYVSMLRVKAPRSQEILWGYRNQWGCQETNKRRCKISLYSLCLKFLFCFSWFAPFTPSIIDMHLFHTRFFRAHQKSAKRPCPYLANGQGFWLYLDLYLKIRSSYWFLFPWQPEPTPCGQGALSNKTPCWGFSRSSLSRSFSSWSSKHNTQLRIGRQ